MLELVRGYAAAVLDVAEAEGALGDVISALRGLGRLLVSSSRLRDALTDNSIAGHARAAVLADLLDGRATPAASALATFPVLYERASELPKTYEQLLELAEQRAGDGGNARVRAEPPIGRSGALERLRGFAERVFETLDSQDLVDALEDELFRLARIAEQQPRLRAALAEPQTPLAERIAVLDSLLEGKVRPETARLAEYVLRCGRARDLVGALDYLVELAAFERGRRVADVRAAIELDASERERLAAALTARVRRRVELRVTVDPAVIGGVSVSVGDTVIDGTLRHRLEQLRETLLQPAG
jgi:F-type H+-transporting ATPase subunit delta